MPDSKQREQIYLAVRKILIAKPEKLNRCVKELTALLAKNNCPRRLGAIAREFLRRLDQFRSYRNYPSLRLPNTTNSVESFNPKSLLLRTKVLIRMRKTITCNPKLFQQN
ncbi:MAG: hypothetical protein UW98_C0002G0019 [Parcubacteria group bacterium GW2011_GWC2_45_15]|nr:MAG: hypothetical protein UW98_C0002G0019 [Parcubacteria group bacterium GW2011_GWC2_45_15]